MLGKTPRKSEDSKPARGRKSAAAKAVNSNFDSGDWEVTRTVLPPPKTTFRGISERPLGPGQPPPLRPVGDPRGNPLGPRGPGIPRLGGSVGAGREGGALRHPPGGAEPGAGDPPARGEGRERHRRTTPRQRGGPVRARVGRRVTIKNLSRGHLIPTSGAGECDFPLRTCDGPGGGSWARAAHLVLVLERELVLPLVGVRVGGVGRPHGGGKEGIGGGGR